MLKYKVQIKYKVLIKFFVLNFVNDTCYSLKLINLKFYICALVFEVFVIYPMYNTSLRMAISGRNIYI